MSAISPDGDQVAFMRMKEGDNQHDIYVQLVSGGEPLQLTDSPEDEWDPTWSPDGQRIAFLRRSGQGWDIYTIHALGGTESKIASSAAHLIGIGLSWSPDGELLAIVDKDSPDDPMSIYLLNLTTGKKSKLTRPPADGNMNCGDRNPRFSPDGKQLAFIRQYPTGGQRRLCSVSLPDGDPEMLTSEASFIMGVDWTEDGHSLVYSSNWEGDQHLYRISSSGGAPARLQIRGASGEPSFPSISHRGGRLVFEQEYHDWNIWRASGPSNTSGSLERLIRSTRYEWYPHYSPDGEKIVFASDRSGSNEIWICDRDGSNWIQLTSFGNQSATTHPRWSPDGRHIAFTRSVEGNWDFFVVSAEGGIPRRLTTEPSNEILPRWSRDGKWIYFCKVVGQELSIWKIGPEGGSASRVLDNAMEVEESPDGNYLYFFRPPVKSPGIWRATVDGKEEIQVIEQGHHKEWTLFEDGVLYVNRASGSSPFLEFHSFTTGEKFQVTILDKPVITNNYGVGVSISPDGRWFLYVQDDNESYDIVMVENFH
jgi:Tol biopolymer transport system component